MSRPLSQILPPSAGMAGAANAPRQIPLTEELERLNQSITLTMQEIDRNFAECHGIITQSILPIVDKYAEHSRELCESVAFWKTFFEDSADVAIGTYESRPEDEMTMTTDQEEGDTTSGYVESSAMEESETTIRRVREGGLGDDETLGEEERTITLNDTDTDSTATDPELEDDSILASMNLTGRDTLDKPRRPKSKQKNGGANWANMQSPYDKLKQEMRSAQRPPQRAIRKTSVDDTMDDSSLVAPSLPAGMSGLNIHDSKSSSMLDPPTTPEAIKGKAARRGNNLLLTSSPMEEDSPFAPSTARQATATKTFRRDPLMHRAVDTNWRVQATPQRKTPRKGMTTVTPKHRVIPSFPDSSPMSSPPPPQITTVFSPINTAKRLQIRPRERPAPAAAPKTPVTARKLTGKNPDPRQMTAKDLFDDDFDDDDDDDDFKKLGFSPPVTMQFTLPPSKLMQTPAKQASRMLVNDIMRSAGFAAGMGGDMTQSTMDDSQGSPSMLIAKSPTYDFD